MATKSIADYQSDYARARANGDAVGMQKANDGANALRKAQGLPAQDASKDIASIAAKSVGGVHTENSPGRVTRPTNDVGITSSGRTTISGYVGPDNNLYYHPYQNDTSTGENSGADSQLSPEGQAKIQQYKAQYDAAKAVGDKAGMEAAHAAAEAIRAQMGYSGGATGNAYNKLVLGQASNPTNLQKLGWDPETGYPGSDQRYWQSGSSGSGSGSYGYGGYDSLEAFKQAMGYDQVSDAQKQAIDAYIQQTIGALESQKTTVDQGAQQAAQQAYLSYMQSRQNLPQALSAGGYSGGMADSQLISLDANLQNNQNSLEQQRLDAIKEIDDAIVSARLEGDIQGANALAALEQQAISAYQDYVAQQEALAQENYWNQYAYDWQAQQAALDRQNAVQDAANSLAANTAWTLMESGVMPTADLLSAAGIDQATAAAYIAARAGTGAAGTTTAGSGTAGSGSAARYAMSDNGSSAGTITGTEGNSSTTASGTTSAEEKAANVLYSMIQNRVISEDEAISALSELEKQGTISQNAWMKLLADNVSIGQRTGLNPSAFTVAQ